MDYIQSVERDAQKIANNCWMNDWRHWLANRSAGVNERCYPDRCTCKDSLHCVPCTRCGVRWRPDTQPMSVHGSLGDYEQWKPVYIAQVIPLSWYDKTKAQYLIGWQDFLQPYVPKMTEQKAIKRVHKILNLYPEVSAWITLEFLYTAINLRWEKMVVLATHLLEQRHKWFTPTGLYASMADTDTYVYDMDISSSGQRVDLPLAAEKGPYCMPKYLCSQDRRESTINLDHSMEGWLSECVPENKTSLVNILSRALACSAAQWRIEECESFHREEQNKILGIVAHDDKRSWTSVYATPFSPSVYWHSNRSVNYCHKCQQDKLSYDPKKSTPQTPYEEILYGANLIRHRRLRGVFWCAVQLIRALYVERSYIPGKGWRYFRALGDFNHHCDKLNNVR